MEGSTNGVNQSVAPEGVHGYLLRDTQINQNRNQNQTSRQIAIKCKKLGYNKITIKQICFKCHFQCAKSITKLLILLI